MESKSQQKRICIQADCIVREELKRLNNEKDARIQELEGALVSAAAKMTSNRLRGIYLAIANN